MSRTGDALYRHLEALHQRALRDDNEAIGDIASLVFPILETYLRATWPDVPRGSIVSAVSDAVMEYGNRPAAVGESRGGRWVLEHLKTAAWRDLRDQERRERRMIGREHAYAADQPRSAFQSDTDVAFGRSAATVQTSATSASGATQDNTFDLHVVAKSCLNGSDWKVFELWMSGEKRTVALAGVLGISDRPPGVQRRLVKQAKDRIRARLRRRTRSRGSH